MKTNIILKIVMVLCLNIAWTGFTNAQTFAYKLHKNASIASYTMPYRLFIPDGYDPNVNYPLVLFLHGAGERGTDNNSHISSSKGATLWAKAANQASHPCFVIAPQCPADKQWVNTNWSNGSYSIDDIPVSNELLMVKDIIASLQHEYSIDSTQMFVTGLSMGGYGTWDFILRYPQMFKAAIPICGAGDPSKAVLLKNTPLRVFHSSDDYTVPVSGSRDMINAINAIGPNSRDEFYTEYTNQGHFSWVNAYNTEDLVPWLFTSTSVVLLCNDSIVPDVTINPSTITTTVNSALQLTATVTPNDICNNSVIWTSANPDVVSVNKNGYIICKGEGETTITSTSSQGGKTSTCAVTVTGKNKKYEAENATLYGITVYNNHNGYSGTGFVAPFHVVGDYLEYSVQKAEAGEQNIILRYSNGYPDDRTISLYVNGEKIRQVNLPNTIDWENWGDRVDKVTLKDGDNTIRYQVDATDNGMFNIDFVLVASSETSGISLPIGADNIYLYPNPNNSILTLANVKPYSKIKAVSIDGKVVSNMVSKAENTKFDVSHWKKGVYIFYIETENSVVTKKAIIR